MHEKIDINNLMLAVIFSALGVILPFLFHLLGLGSIFLPMYIPLALGAYLLTKRNAFLMGFFTPLFSAVLTGMPPFYPPVAFMMMVQLSLFCVLIASLSHRTRMPVLAVFLAAMAVDRILLLVLYRFIAPMFLVDFRMFTAYDILKGLPGIILMAVLLPFLVPRSTAILAKHSLSLYEHSREEHCD